MRACLTAMVIMVTAVFLGGCTATAADWSQPHPKPSAVGRLGPGFVDPTAPPSPEATITPRPGSWRNVHPSSDYRVVLLSAGDDQQTKILINGVQSWADQEKVSLKTVTADAGDLVPAITRAMKLKPDLIISAGQQLIDPLALVSANHLDQQFLVIGAELAEPTENVTAANWVGATFRGEGLGTATRYDPASFTPGRVDAAVRAGVASVLTGFTGIVIQLPSA